MRPPAKPESVSPLRVRHVGSAVFAAILCRKFANAAVFSWHLPHHKNAAAINGCGISNCRPI
jgi:hypothetical protein